jgi:hypothetical protein
MVSDYSFLCRTISLILIFTENAECVRLILCYFVIVIRHYLPLSNIPKSFTSPHESQTCAISRSESTVLAGVSLVTFMSSRHIYMQTNIYEWITADGSLVDH